MGRRQALPDKLLAFSRAHGLFPAGARVLCALSGGADSVSLLGALLLLREALGLSSVAAAHFNHRLRGADADADEAFVRALCADLGAPLFTGGADVAGVAEARRANLEDTARSLRYAFLRRTAAREGFTRIATGHTADDNVETVLLHLSRGAGLAGLAGIPPVRDILARPLLSCTRADVTAFLAARGLPHIEDATNADLALARNRVRHCVVPGLRAVNPRLSDAVSGLSARLRRDETYIEAQAQKEMVCAADVPAGVSYPADRLAALPPALSARVCRLLFQRASGRAGDAPASAHIEAVLSLCAGVRPSASAALPGGLTARRSYDSLIIGPPPPRPRALTPRAVTVGDRLTFPAAGLILSCRRVPSAGRSGRCLFYLAPERIQGDLTARARRTGDRLTRPGKPGGRTLKRLMIDAKIPAHIRDAWPVIADDGGVLAVPGLGASAAHIAAPGAPAVEISFCPAETTED